MEELKKNYVPAFFFWLGIFICAAIAVYLWPDRHYYLLPTAQRVLNPGHAVLRSSGRGGLTFGAVGTLLILVNLTYLIRKQLIRFAWLGSLRSWMAFHVFTGLLAGVMVLLHSALLLRSALGILAFFSMIVVLVTGLIGRYIYAHTPHSLKGRELKMEEIRADLTEYQTRLQTMGVPLDFFATALATPVAWGSDKGIFGILVGMAAGDRELRRAHKEMVKLVHSHLKLKSLAGEIIPVADRYCQEMQWLARYQELRSLMGSWRFFHKWFAIVLLGAVLFHIFVAFQMGNLWLVDVVNSIVRPHG